MGSLALQAQWLQSRLHQLQARDRLLAGWGDRLLLSCVPPLAVVSCWWLAGGPVASGWSMLAMCGVVLALLLGVVLPLAAWRQLNRWQLQQTRRRQRQALHQARLHGQLPWPDRNF